jgi:GTP:adenosylcobinamide-phosphate guanylyltransferase
MNALILAGGVIKKNDPLWIESNGNPKSYIIINGKPMIQWIINALNEAELIESIHIIGIPESENIESKKKLFYYPDQGGILENLLFGAGMIMKDNPVSNYFLTVSADIPLIYPEIVDSIIKKADNTDVDIFYNVVEKSNMLKVFPNVKRTYMRFKEGLFCGGDMHVVNAKYMIGSVAQKFVEYRKNPLKLIFVVGFMPLVRMIIKPYSLSEAEKVIFKRTGIRTKPTICNYAEIGMDIDTPEQLEIARDYISKKYTSNK